MEVRVGSVEFACDRANCGHADAESFISSEIRLRTGCQEEWGTRTDKGWCVEIPIQKTTVHL